MVETGVVWYRVELNKDGSISKCDQVEESNKAGKFVRFVQANSPAEACQKAKEWWGQKKKSQAEAQARYRAKLDSSGLCRACGKAPKTNGLLCRPCRTRATQSVKNWNARKLALPAAPPSQVPRHRTAEAALEAHRASEKAARQIFKERHPERLKMILAVTALAKFDELGPKAFREWLVGLIEAAKGKAA